MNKCLYLVMKSTEECSNSDSIEKIMGCKILESSELGLGTPDTCPYCDVKDIQNCKLRKCGFNASDKEVDDFIKSVTL